MDLNGFRISWVFLAAFMLVACGSDGTSVQSTETINISGAVQKGPFIVGTPVFVNKLDKYGNASESVVITDVQDSIGSFSFNISETGPVQIVSNGYYFSELTGQISSGTLTLKAIYDASAGSSQVAYVNILTHLINNRVLELIKPGDMAVSDAISQAQTELIAALNDVLPVDTLPDFNVLSVYNLDSQNAAGNSYLLALSTSLYKYAEIKSEGQNTSADAQLSLVLNQIAQDFSADGLIQQQGFIEELTVALRRLNPAEITDNLKQRSSIDFSQPFDVPDITSFFGLCAGAAECAWSSRAPTPIPFSQHSAAVYNGKIYVFGGSGTNGVSSLVYFYDPETNEWSQVSSMPLGVRSATASISGNKIYIIGGFAGYDVINGYFRNEVQIYDPENDTWSFGTSMPSFRYAHTSTVVGNSIYVIGGHGAADGGPWTGPGTIYQSSDRTEIYDTLTDSWSAGQAAPMTVSSSTACEIGGTIYMIGGYEEYFNYTDVLAYDSYTDTWSRVSPIMENQSGHSCLSLGDSIVIFGGKTGDASVNNALESIETYTSTQDTWSKSDLYLPTARYWHTTSLLDNKAYFIGGITGSNWEKVDAVEVLDLTYLDY